jgi:hypothetical protein
MELFPEIIEFSDMYFRDPCKKTRGRFKASSVRPEPLESRLRARAVYQKRVQRNLRVVADASLRLVPSLLLQLAPIEEIRKAKRRDRNRHLYVRMRNLQTQQLSDVRVAVMRDLLHAPKKRQLVKSPRSPSQVRTMMTIPDQVPSNRWTHPSKGGVVRFNDPRVFDLTTIHEIGF